MEQRRSIEFVQLTPGGEGLMFNLPTGYRKVKSGQLPGGVPFQTYLPAGEPNDARRLFLDVLAFPAARLGAKGVVTPERYLMLAAMGMRDKVCPESFGVSVLGPIRRALGQHQDAAPAAAASDFAVVMGCGRTPMGQSETTLMASFRNDGDLVVVNWTERGAARDGGPAALDQRLWLSRLRELQPSRLCAADPGGTGPSSSCVMDAIGSLPTTP